jgi:hypothetical protein
MFLTIFDNRLDSHVEHCWQPGVHTIVVHARDKHAAASIEDVGKLFCTEIDHIQLG